MLQVVQNYRNGELKVTDVPVPVVHPSGVLVRNVASVVSVGTEKLMMDMARKSLVGKAKARPDLVRQVISKARTDGLLETYRAVMGRLDNLVPLGYSSAGQVIAVGKDVDEFRVGDRVACFGSGYATHSEVVSVQRNLAASIPDAVGFEEASFAGVGSIALHAVRMGEPCLGDRVVVIGLGLLGLLAAQILRAWGCHVFGTDPNPSKVELAHELGIGQAEPTDSDVAAKITRFCHGDGADLALIFASADSREPVNLAAEVLRPRGRLVVPGMVKLELPRRTFYDKEIHLAVSRSAGPGIGDTMYQERGIDYPIEYVRWTSKRNAEEFLVLVELGQVRLSPMITHRFDIRNAQSAYEMVSDAAEPYVGVLLTYPEAQATAPRITLMSPAKNVPKPRDKVGVGMVGAGLFAKSTLLPALKKMGGVSLRGIVTARGTSARHVGEKYGFFYCASEYEELLGDPEVDCLVIATRHNLHANQAVKALEAEKDVFLEKPLATDADGLRALTTAYYGSGKSLMVGFNRRFSPLSVKAKDALRGRRGPLVIHCRVNAGAVPKDSWVNDPVEGGGRIVGEVCHFVDLAQYFTDSQPVRVHAETVRGSDDVALDKENVIITLTFRDGSVASIVYVSQGDRTYSRELVELFWEGSVCRIDNFKGMTLVERGKQKQTKRWNVDRGHRAELEAFFGALRHGQGLPVPFHDYVYTTLATFCIEESIKAGTPVDVDPVRYGLELPVT